VLKYFKHFKSKTKDQNSNLLLYFKGLFQGKKRNIERMGEAVKDSDYNALQHFISEAPWDHRGVMDQVSQEVNSLLQTVKTPIGFIIDESSHEKKGDKSVGTAKQYCGTKGKIENCQVAVYGAYSTGNLYGLSDCSLFLPNVWIKDKKRCEKAGIPKQHMVYKSKPQLALEMIKRQLALGNQIDFVGGDGLYGNDYSLMDGLDELGLTGVLDVHADQYVFLEEPVIAIPDKKEGKGRTATKYKASSKAIEVRVLKNQLQERDFEEITIRSGTKGAVKSKVTVINVYTWDGHSSCSKQRQLLIRVSQTDSGSEEIKYALCNAKSGQYTPTQMAQMQAQRYFVERAFQECKSDLGMSEYQVRGWKAWHHHMAMCMMAQAYVLTEKKEHQENMPLLSAYDIRQVIMQTYIRKDDEYEQVEAQIKYRHKQRQDDIIRRNRQT
jgi:SRSO17 transposase